MSLAESRFEHVVRNIAVDPAVFEIEFSKATPATLKYVIFFSARSGSSWLTSVLSRTKRFGFPEEYLNPDFVPGVGTAMNTKDPEKFISALIRRRKTPNGVFGIEVRAVDVKLFSEEIFFDFFGARDAVPTTYFLLWRDDIVAQGVSLYRAVTTRRFHSSDGQDGLPPPEYDADDIQRWITHVPSTENENLRMLNSKGLAFTSICYEDIVKDRLGTIKLFADALKVDVSDATLNGSAIGELKRVGDDWNKETVRRFQAERAEFLAEIAKDRLVKRPNN